MKTYGLFAFSERGQSVVISTVHADSAEVAAAMLGGRITEPFMAESVMLSCALGLPQVGESWDQFEFDNNNHSPAEAMSRLGKLTGQRSAEEFGSVENRVGQADILIIARVPHLEG